jgi:4'-phosphopantetheinyl transferase
VHTLATVAKVPQSGVFKLRRIDAADFAVSDRLSRPDLHVDLWRVDLDATADAESRWRSLLSGDELQRAQRFHFERDRKHFCAARGLLRTVLSGYLAVPAKDIAFRYREKGKPELAACPETGQLNFNVSHSGGVALFGFTCDRAIGVDVEKIRTDFDTDAIARRFFSEREREQLASLPQDQRHDAFFRYWTLKEAFIKGLGEGLSHPLHQFDVTIESPIALITRPDASEAALWSLQRVDAGPEHAAAVAVRR